MSSSRWAYCYLLGPRGTVHYCKDILLLVCSWDGARQLFTFLIRELTPQFVQSPPGLCIIIPSLCFVFLILHPEVARSPFLPWLCLEPYPTCILASQGRGSGRGLEALRVNLYDKQISLLMIQWSPFCS